MPTSKEDDKSSWEQSLGYNIVVALVNECIWSWVAFDYAPCFSTSFSIIFIFTSFSFSLISLPSAVYISSFSIISFPIFSFNVCWSFLACLGVINFNLISCPSCLKQRERLSRLSVLKWSHAHPKGWWQEFVGAMSHNTSFTHCYVLNLILDWFRIKLVGNLSFSTNLWLTTLLSLS